MVANHGIITIQLSLYIVIYHIFSPLRTGISGHHLVKDDISRLLEPQLINVQALQALQLPLRLRARKAGEKPRGKTAEHEQIGIRIPVMGLKPIYILGYHITDWDKDWDIIYNRLLD